MEMGYAGDADGAKLETGGGGVSLIPMGVI